MRLHRILVASGLVFSVTAMTAARIGSAGIVYNESVNGDITGDRFNPLHLTLGFGSNFLTATSSTGDREYVWFSLPPGKQIDNIKLNSWSGIDQIGFIAVQEGMTFTEPFTVPDIQIGNILGYTHMGPGAGNLGSDILPAMGQGAGAIGFTPPLTESEYTFWIQQTGSNPVTYELEFVVSPEPASLALLGLIALAFRRRR